MANFSLYKIKNFIGSLGKFQQGLGVLFMVALMVILILDALVIKDALGSVIISNQDVVPVSHISGVRIDFNSYNAVVDRIQGAANFQPSLNVTDNPFSGQ